MGVQCSSLVGFVGLYDRFLWQLVVRGVSCSVEVVDAGGDISITKWQGENSGVRVYMFLSTVGCWGLNWAIGQVFRLGMCEG